jgi:hypothetical protein
MERNLSKERSLHKAADPLFWNEFIIFSIDRSIHICIFKQLPKYINEFIFAYSEIIIVRGGPMFVVFVGHPYHLLWRPPVPKDLHPHKQAIHEMTSLWIG